MPENCFAIIPPEGYPIQKKQSIKAARLIQGIAKKQDTKIYHALNGGEKKLCGHYVDGYDPVSYAVYEFQGCYWHGCKRCYPDRQKINTYSCSTMNQLYLQTCNKIETLKQAGYEVIELWECEYEDLYKDNQEFKDMVDT